MNKIAKEYIDSRISAVKELKGIVDDEQIYRLLNFFNSLDPILEDVTTEEQLQEAKQSIKNGILEAIEVKNIEDTKRRAFTVQFFYNIVDYHHNDPNSKEAIAEFSKDMGMTVNGYLTFAFMIAVDMAYKGEKKVEEKGKSKKLIDLLRFD